MDTPIRSAERARPLPLPQYTATPWYEATLIEASALARARAVEFCRPDVADDIAQDVVLFLLEKFSSGRITEPPTHLEALVKRMVRQLAIDRTRRDRARPVRDAAFAAEVAAA